MKFVIINGPCGVGKTSVSKLVHQEWSMSLLLPIDELRRLYSGFRQAREESMMLTNEMGRAMARVSLNHGHSVILEGLKTRQDLLDPWVQLAREHQADVYEYMLWAPKDLVLRRADERGYRPGGLLTPEKVERFWDELDALRTTRPGMIELDAEHHTPKELADSILRSLS